LFYLTALRAMYFIGRWGYVYFVGYCIFFLVILMRRLHKIQDCRCLPHTKYVSGRRKGRCQSFYFFVVRSKSGRIAILPNSISNSRFLYVNIIHNTSTAFYWNRLVHLCTCVWCKCEISTFNGFKIKPKWK